MQSSALDDELFQGHSELERGDGWLKPWRLPHSRRALFPSPDEGLRARAETASSVRLRLSTESRRIRLRFQPLPTTAPAGGRTAFHFDLTIGEDLVVSAAVSPGGFHRGYAGKPTHYTASDHDPVWASLELLSPPPTP